PILGNSSRMSITPSDSIPVLVMCLRSNLKWLTFKMYDVDFRCGLVVRVHSTMGASDTSSAQVDASSFAYVVGIDIGSQTCSFCVCKPDKSQVIKPTEFANG